MKNLWSAREAAKCRDKIDLLVYSSQLIGTEPKLCVWGGGNTSTKMAGHDHLGKPLRILYIKGSGSDLKVSTRRDYPPVALEELKDVFKRKSMTDEDMVDYVSRCLLEPKAPRPSIEVLLHAFIEEEDIHHTHADAILALTNTLNNRQIVRKVFGDELIWIPYVKPGFTLAKWMGEAYRRQKGAKGAILEKHGLITWGPDAKTSYDRTIEMVTRAEKFLAQARRRKKYWSPSVYRELKQSQKKEWLIRFLPVIRRVLSAREKVLLHFDDSSDVMDFINTKDAKTVSQQGPATPDHMLRTKRVPLYIEPNKNILEISESQLVRQIENYAKSHERYFKKFRNSLPDAEKTAMLDPYPKVILVPGIGMISSGKDLKSSAIVAEIYQHSISVMRNASTIDRYVSLSERLAFEMDYWPMELYKLSLAPPEAELSRQVGLVTGGVGGIGRSVAHVLAARGAHVIVSDLDAVRVNEVCEEINQKIRAQRAFPIAMDVTKPESVRAAIESAVLKLGGFDFLVSNAGIAHVSAIDQLELKDWEKSFAVNSTGHFLVAKEAVRVMKRQALGGSLVFMASKNVLAPGKDFGAYSAAKAAEAQLARILAIENGEFQIRVNMVNPDGIFENSGLWQVIGKNRAKSYGIPAEKLADFYKNRNLMKTRVFPEDVAEAVAFLVSHRSAKMTGCILTVDGGVKEAFPR